MIKKICFGILILSIALLTWEFIDHRLKAAFYQWQFDKLSRQKAVTSKKKIDAVLAQFEKVHFSKMEKEYLTYTKFNQKKYRKLAQTSHFLIVEGKDIFRYLVGEFRVKDFLPRDKDYYNNLEHLGSQQTIPWLIDKKLLYKLLELQNLLAENGYNKAGFSIVNGYRHPAYNEAVGGASLSRHLKGQALDLQIKDINQDGKINQKDKTIVLDLLEKKVIGNQGGIGRYPGTMAVHFDVRGYRARWDAH
ncbi:MAG: D-Ala-D-Ala carboxypeptidase family metallohydrolase [Bacteroidota bacterium]